MKTLDIINTPWAIREDLLSEIIAVYRGHLIRGEKVDFNALSFDGDRAENKIKITNGNAVIPIKGPITKGNSLFSFFFSGSSSDYIKSQLIEAVENRDVEKIILDIDSPGGTVDGSFELADFIQSIEKPVIAYTDGTIASAAYLIASAADEIVITGKTNQIGSIGVIATHIDFSKQSEMMGETVTEIVSGKYKNAASPETPLTEFGKETLQNQVDYIFSIFAKDVAERRGMELQSVIDMQARVFIGQESIDAGLVDSVSTIDQLLSDNVSVGSIQKIHIKPASTPILTGVKMDRKTLQDEHPETYAEVLQAGIEEGIEKEKQRVSAIKDNTIQGHEDLADKMIKEGMSIEDAKTEFIRAENRARSNFEAEKGEEKIEPVEKIENQTPEDEEKAELKDFMVLVKEKQNKERCSLKKAISECSTQYPEEYNAYLKR